MTRTRIGLATTLGALALVIFAMATPSLAGQASGKKVLTCPNMSGAVYTTDLTGAAVNQNLFAEKEAAFLRIASPNGKRLSNDWYDWYAFRVTNPSGSLELARGTFQVSGGVITRVDHILPEAVMQSPNSTRFRLFPFDDTDNPGGEYKAWVTPKSVYDSLGFVEACSKTDNFKIARQSHGQGNDKEERSYTVTLQGTTYCGSEKPAMGWQSTDPRFEGAEIVVTQIYENGSIVSVKDATGFDVPKDEMLVFSDADGKWTAQILPNGPAWYRIMAKNNDASFAGTPYYNASIIAAPVSARYFIERPKNGMIISDNLFSLGVQTAKGTCTTANPPPPGGE